MFKVDHCVKSNTFQILSTFSTYFSTILSVLLLSVQFFNVATKNNLEIKVHTKRLITNCLLRHQLCGFYKINIYFHQYTYHSCKINSLEY